MSRPCSAPAGALLSRRRLLTGITGAVGAALLASTGAPVVASPARALDIHPGGFASWHEYQPFAPGGFPSVLTMGADDVLWYADPLSNQVVRMPTALPGAAVPFDLGITSPGVSSMVVAPDGALWLSDFVNAAICRLDPTTGLVDSFPLLGPFDWTSQLVLGPGGSIWFGDPMNYGLAAIAPDGHITRFAEPAGAEIAHLVSAADGRLWYTMNTGSTLGAFDPRSGFFEVYPVPVGEFTGLALANSGDLWVAGVDTLVRLGLDGSTKATPTLPPSPAGYTSPRYLITGVDAELHFTDFSLGIATVDRAGTVAYTRPPFADSVPERLAMTSYGSLWYLDAVRATIGNV